MISKKSKAGQFIYISAIVVLFMIALAPAKAQPRIPSNANLTVENVSENFALELWPNANFHFWDNGSVSVCQENIIPENLPLSSATLETDYTSPSPERLKIDLSASGSLSPSGSDWLLKQDLTLFGRTENVGDWLPALDNGLINEHLLDNLEGKRLSEINVKNRLENKMGILPTKYVALIENLKIENNILALKDNSGHVVIEEATCTDYHWDESNENLQVALTVTLDNIGFLGDNTYRASLPISENLEYQFVSGDLDITAESKGENAEANLEFQATQNDSCWQGDIQVEATGEIPRANDNVSLKTFQSWNFLPFSSGLNGMWTLLDQNRSIFNQYWSKIRQYGLDNSQFIVKLRTPENATVENLPENYLVIAPNSNYYEWLDENAINGALDFIKRENIPEVEYLVTEVFTQSAVNVTSSGATLKSSIVYGGYDNVDVKFGYRKSGASSWSYTSGSKNYTANTYSESVSLNSSTTYEFRAIIGDNWWRDTGKIKTFTTSAPPSPPTPGNRHPDADPNGPYTVNENATIALDGTGSSDPDGSIESYSWSILSDPTGAAFLSDSDNVVSVFHAPEVETDTNVLVLLTVTDDDGASNEDTATVSVRYLPPAPSPQEIENMTPENAAEELSKSEPKSAAKSFENVIKDNIDFAANVADSGFKRGLTREMAGVLNHVDTLQFAELLKRVYDLPETPEAAVALLSATNIGKSTAGVQTLIEWGDYEYIGGMFTHLVSENVNNIYEGLTITQRGELYPELSQNVRDKIAADLAPRFDLSDLSVSKETVVQGGKVVINVDVKNTGGTPYLYTVELTVGEKHFTENVSPGVGKSETAEFSVSMGKVGTYDVYVDGLNDSFTVKKGFPWGIVGLVVIVVVVGILGGIWFWKRG